MDVIERIQTQVKENPVIIYMKGTPQAPMCGFSARTVEVLKQCGEEFGYVNIFADPEVYQNLPKFSEWPTFPQVFIDGELVGGCDITLELFQQGKLQDMVKQAFAKK